MNKTIRIVAAVNSHANPFQLKACFFHSTPVLERRRRTNWDNVASSFRSAPKKFNQYSKRIKRQTLLRNVGEFAEHLFESFQANRDGYDQSSNSWFRPNSRDDGYKKRKSSHRRSQPSKKHYEFCDSDDDIEFETIIHSAFGGNRHIYWSSVDDDEPRFRNSSSYSSYYRTSGSKRYQYDEDHESSSESEKPMRDNTSDRLVLGLSTSGPLNVEDVKNAYRKCALKWHPDRHPGSSKQGGKSGSRASFRFCLFKNNV